jgi:hypothetical protein
MQMPETLQLLESFIIILELCTGFSYNCALNIFVQTFSSSEEIVNQGKCRLLLHSPSSA